MRTPAQAIGWEFLQRHRWGLIAVAGYVTVLAAIKLVLAVSGQSINLGTDMKFALAVSVPLAATFTYFLALFTYGLDGDLAARESMYPARKFTLPVSTAALAFWPMLYGTFAITLLWAGMRLFGLWPADVPVPVIWPAVGAASLLAWTQALMWMPYGLRGLRVVVAVFLLQMIDTIVLISLYVKAPESVMLAILAPQVPLAYLAGRIAVARARRGDVPDWSGVFVRLGQMTDVRRGARDHFASPERAQLWFEWRQHGKSLPVLVALVLPFELALLFLIRESHVLVIYLLFGVLLTPPLMAAFAAATVRRTNTFTTTRPMSTAGLIAAKLKLTIWSTLFAWLLVLVAIPSALALTGTVPVVTEFANKVSNAVGTPRAIVLGLLLIGGLMMATWKLLVQSMYIGLTGNESLIKGSVFVVLSLIAVLGPILNWIGGSNYVQGVLWDSLPRILAVLVALKMAAAVWVAVRLYHSRLLSDRTLIKGAACWTATVLALYALLVWCLSVPLLPSYCLALVAILAVPLARVSAAPLGLAWNRSR